MAKRRIDFDEDYLIANAETLTDREIAEHLGCSTVKVWQERKRLGLPHKRKRCSAEMIDYISKHYNKDMTPREIADVLGIKRQNLYRIADYYGIQNPKKFL